jgi:hypothetical protein
MLPDKTVLQIVEPPSEPLAAVVIEGLSGGGRPVGDPRVHVCAAKPAAG